MCNTHTLHIDRFKWNKLQLNSGDAIIYSLKSTTFNILHMYCIQYVSTMVEKNAFLWRFCNIHFFQDFILPNFVYETIHTHFFHFASHYFVIAWMKHDFFFSLQYRVSNRFCCCFCTNMHIYMWNIIHFSIGIDTYWCFFNEISWLNKM